MEIVTIPERKARAAAAKRRAVAAVLAELLGVARSLSGRFLLYGSAARGEVRWNSDVDLLLDFPDQDRTTAAGEAAEAACGRHGLECDIAPLAWCKPDFLAHVLVDAVVIG